MITAQARELSARPVTHGLARVEMPRRVPMSFLTSSPCMKARMNKIFVRFVEWFCSSCSCSCVSPSAAAHAHYRCVVVLLCLKATFFSRAAVEAPTQDCGSPFGLQLHVSVFLIEAGIRMRHCPVGQSSTILQPSNKQVVRFS